MQTGSGAQRRSVYKGIRWRDDISFTDDGKMIRGDRYGDEKEEGGGGDEDLR